MLLTSSKISKTELLTVKEHTGKVLHRIIGREKNIATAQASTVWI